MSTEAQIIAERKKKLEEWRALGFDYASKFERTHTSAEAASEVKKKAPRDVTAVLQKPKSDRKMCGRIMNLRDMGKLTFLKIRDIGGDFQICLARDVLGEKYKTFLRILDLGDFCGFEGEFFVTKHGEPTLLAVKVTPLAKTLRPLPEKFHGLTDQEARYRQRYLDLIMNLESKRRFVIRSKVITAIRNFLDERGFLEVETPTLQPVYGGGFARPFVTHHNALNNDFYLRISDEMYLKRLIVGGMGKVYEITKVFRNEGIDHNHNPEFTMWEAQIEFEDYTYGMDLIENIFEHVALKVLKTTKLPYGEEVIDVKKPWKRYKLVEAVKKFTGIDPLEWKNPKEAEKAIHKMGIAKEKLDALKTMRTVGEMIAFAFEETVEKKLIQPTIIYDYPVEVSPLAKRCEDDPRFTQRFEMFLFGTELGNNYSELNDPQDLWQRFVEEKKKEAAGFKEAHQTDYDYLTAIEHGFPPTCGVAIGIDRMIMLFTNSENIKEIIAFPTMKPEGGE